MEFSSYVNVSFVDISMDNMFAVATVVRTTMEWNSMRESPFISTMSGQRAIREPLTNAGLNFQGLEISGSMLGYSKA